MPGSRGNKFLALEMLKDEVYNILVPLGCMLPFTGTTAPSANWIIPTGQILSTTTYAAYYALVGNTFNTGGEAAGTFRAPNLVGRSPVGVGTYTDPVSGSVTRTLGQYLGAEKHVLTLSQIPSHNHGGGNHSHIYRSNENNGSSNSGTSGDPASKGFYDRSSGGSGVIIATQGGDAAHNNMQPSIGVNWILRVI